MKIVDRLTYLYVSVKILSVLSLSLFYEKCYMSNPLATKEARINFFAKI